ncbi:CLUMA_CG005302, isoform A [Clunio marinus]|uniref:CLUMA_CG005302, isoform A n=1 Tax=Clunio marinus TaxID=568069 RepID=A0A1J1HWB7_9DIPT|nr:CLUMA_CG005302, isoform A [Clunio marinus]
MACASTKLISSRNVVHLMLQQKIIQFTMNKSLQTKADKLQKHLNSETSSLNRKSLCFNLLTYA